MFGLILNGYLYGKGKPDHTVQVSYLGEYEDLIARQTVDPEREEASWPSGDIVPRAEIYVKADDRLGTLRAHVCSLKVSRGAAAGNGGDQ